MGNGGPTLTFALLPDSPAIDSGDSFVCPLTDQRGIPRPQGGSCDVGAFELEAKLALSKDLNGLFTLNSAFAANITNVISASINLIDWTPIGVRTSDADGRLEFSDPKSPQLPS